MKATPIKFEETGFFSKTIIDYLNQTETIQPFYNNFPDQKGFQQQLVEKQESFNLSSRKILVEALQNQYKNVDSSTLTQTNIDSLSHNNTFTITTGHQLNLFTGPLYFLYKIISAINLCTELKSKFPDCNFVPVYWMATEDHDFEEINYFNFKGKKVAWNSNQTGAVGRFSTKGLEDVFNVFALELGNHKNAIYLKNLFQKGYLEHSTLAEATRFIANELFEDQGLVIVDGDDVELKKMFAPIVKDELLNETSYKAVTKTIEKLELDYKIQVNPREINLFYLTKGVRERIIFEDDVYKVNNTSIIFSKEEILQEVDHNPKAFSPNVIMRPLYQEVILPNLCYIGGGGELAYWFELKSYFEKVKIPFPILLLRNSVQIVSEKQAKKLAKLKIEEKEIFTNQTELLAKKVIENSNIKISFEEKINFLQNQFEELKTIATETDATFLSAVNAQETKQIKGLKTLQKRLIRAEKRRQADLVDRITILQNELLPNQSLEERQRNFSEFYLEHGNHFLKAIKLALKPLDLQFTVLEI
ncbi:bacillithiol biosynthesis cysteine-adding enzyme BshC [Polaribacter sp.]|nr:bacillithiol biosynthesis cysteine-adding enzyme BshC [Polaribacter sp.]